MRAPIPRIRQNQNPLPEELWVSSSFAGRCTRASRLRRGVENRKGRRKRPLGSRDPDTASAFASVRLARTRTLRPARGCSISSGQSSRGELYTLSGPRVQVASRTVASRGVLTPGGSLRTRRHPIRGHPDARLLAARVGCVAPVKWRCRQISGRLAHPLGAARPVWACPIGSRRQGSRP